MAKFSHLGLLVILQNRMELVKGAREPYGLEADKKTLARVGLASNFLHDEVELVVPFSYRRQKQ